MIRTRLMTNAFILNGDNVLVLNRSSHKRLAPGLWTGVGGHIEPAEINDPVSSCLREIYEETGLQQSSIEEFKLLYIVNRLWENEIRQQYIFFGKTKSTEVLSNDEGELHWIGITDLLELEMPLTIKYTIEHFLNHNGNQILHIGTVTQNKNKLPDITWTPLIDPEAI
jgi:8-oxo-dGTP diphosphatase